MDFDKVKWVALLVSRRAKALSYLYRPPQDGGATYGGGGWICLTKSAKYPGCEIKFGINITHAYSPLISKLSVDLFNAEVAIINGRQMNAWTDNTVHNI